MIAAAACGSLTPASSITIWFEPCLRISGSLTPSLSIRLRMIPIERSTSVEVSCLPFGGTAFSTTSRPPWRSRPSRGFLCTGASGDREERDPDESREDQAEQDEIGAPVVHLG